MPKGNLNGKISDTEDYTFSRTYWTNPTYSIKVKNKVVYIEYYCSTSEGIGGHAYQIADLPSDVAPGRRIRSAAWTAGGDGMRHGASIDISSTGAIQLIAGANFIEGGFSISYPL